MDADLRRLERLAEMGDAAAAHALAAARDRVTPPWSIDPRRDPVRRLLARSMSNRSARRVARALPRFEEGVYCVWRRPFKDITIAGRPVDLAPLEQFRVEFSWRDERVLHCYERWPLRESSNLIGYPPAPFSWLERVVRRMRSLRSGPSRRRFVYRARRRLERHEADCDRCPHDRCDQYLMLAAQWRQANYDSHATPVEPVFPMPVSMFPGPEAPGMVCNRCKTPSGQWPARACTWD